MATNKNAVVEKENEIAVYDYGDYEGAGMEGAGREAYAIPFLQVLQKGSPQVDEVKSQYIEGARQGMIFETVSQRLFDGKTGVLIIPCFFQRVFLRWAPRSQAGGFRGRITGDEFAQMKARGQIVDIDGRPYAVPEDGTRVHPDRSDRFAEAHYRYCLLVDEETGYASRVLFSIVSTQLKKSQGLAARIDGVRVKTPDGRLAKPPTFAHKVRMTTIPEENDKGSWYGIKFELAGLLAPNDPLFKEALDFHEQVKGGEVQVSEEPGHQSESDAGNASNSSF